MYIVLYNFFGGNSSNWDDHFYDRVDQYVGAAKTWDEAVAIVKERDKNPFTIDPEDNHILVIIDDDFTGVREYYTIIKA